jgi:hypothetical protein
MKTKKEIFKAAHRLAKETIQKGDNYQVTFAACLKLVYNNSKSEIVHFLKLSYKDKRNQKTAKINGFKWNPQLKLWENKKGVEMDATYSLFEYRVKSETNTDNSVNSGFGFNMKNTAHNQNLVNKYGYDAIEYVS